MKKIVIDAGHGLNTLGKQTPDGEKEWTFNNKVALVVIEQLQSFQNVQVLRVDDPTGKSDSPLRTRTNRANDWHADVFISIHHNALGNVWGKHGGVECYTMDHPKANVKSVEIAKLIQPRLVKASRLRDRGIKRANFHVLRETKMPAVLIEGGFMDSITDIEVLRNDQLLKAQGVEIAAALAHYFKLAVKQSVIQNEKGVVASETHEEAWLWASNAGYLDGKNPREALTREQFATVLKRYDERA